MSMPSTSSPERAAHDGGNIPIQDANGVAEETRPSGQSTDSNDEVEAIEPDVVETAEADKADVAEEATLNDAAASPEASADAAESAEDGEAAEDKPDVTVGEVLAAAEAEVKEWKDKYLRLHAEWDTYRRRTSEQREAEKARATEKLVTSLLPVIDDFERTISYANENGEAGLLEGVQAVHTKLIEVLTKDGVEIIDPAGEAFDALESQAVATVEDDSVPDETVAEVYQRGYRMGKKVLRPAMVTVTTGGPKRETPQEDDEEQQ